MSNFLIALFSFMFIAALINMAQHDNGESELKPKKHIILRVVAWILAVVGLVVLIALLSMILGTNSKAAIPLRPMIFNLVVIFGLSSYFFNFKSSKCSIIKKVLKLLYVIALIFSFHGVFLTGDSLIWDVIFFILAIPKAYSFNISHKGLPNRDELSNRWIPRKK